MALWTWLCTLTGRLTLRGPCRTKGRRMVDLQSPRLPPTFVVSLTNISERLVLSKNTAVSDDDRQGLVNDGI
ncbi:hypothetical protein DE146DRAFT_666235 [Phaeosphaeria sp. MPI-PUGE-AT-0046c]|nr:hypothetical protein DE146DRAFT_666235 [Phaeosphaeria sp. MPI-PUGE-AT-0046c]